MGRIDDALRTLENIPLGTERALHLAALISTLFKINGVAVVATRHLAFHSYADTQYSHPEVELGPLLGTLPPRTVLDVMRGQLHAKGATYHWTVAGMPVRFHDSVTIVNRVLCRDVTTELGVIKLVPVEEITADYILASVYPEPDTGAYVRAHRLLFSGLTEAFEMDWQTLHALCHRPEYRVGEQLAQMRMEAKKEVDAQGRGRDHIGDSAALPTLAEMEAKEAAGEEKPGAPSAG
jgi:hypothetical protein